MVRPYYKVDCIDGQWAIVVAKGKKAGTIFARFNSSNEAWEAFNNMNKADVEL